MTHTERVRNMAEKMAKAEYSKAQWDSFSSWQKGTHIKRFSKYATIAVAEQAEAFKEGWTSRHEPTHGTGWTHQSLIEHYLQSHGFISEPKTQGK